MQAGLWQQFIMWFISAGGNDKISDQEKASFPGAFPGRSWLHLAWNLQWWFRLSHHHSSSMPIIPNRPQPCPLCEDPGIPYNLCPFALFYSRTSIGVMCSIDRQKKSSLFISYALETYLNRQILIPPLSRASVQSFCRHLTSSRAAWIVV